MPRRRLATLLCALAPAVAMAAPGAPPELPAAAAALRARFGEGLGIRTARATGVARWVRLAPEAPDDLSPERGKPLEARALAFVAEWRALFGLADPAAELRLVSRSTDALGQTHLRFRQVHRGVPVFAAELRAHFDRRERLRAVQGVVVPRLEVDPLPIVPPDDALHSARAFVAAQLGLAVSPFAGAPELTIYRSGLERPAAGRAVLVWSVEVEAGGLLRARVFVDARQGKVVDWLAESEQALVRRAYSGIDQAPLDGLPDSYPAHPDWVEGDPEPTGLAELDTALAATADTYRVYSALGRDSYDGSGHGLDLSWNHPTLCPNASWNGRLASFCAGFAVHDVVAHEWSHAYLRATSGLIYRWQSGALNESFADVWGESIDQATQLAEVHDSDAPATRRAGSDCSSFVPARLRILAPASLAGDAAVGLAAFGSPVSRTAPLPVVRVVDAGGASAYDGCEALLDARVAGAIAFADRGACDFETQARHAQAAGAAALLIGNLPDSADPEVPPAMGCDAVTGCDRTLTLPTLSLAAGDAERLRAAAAGSLRARLLAGGDGAATVRWLLGEDVRPLGVARDMWNPSCLGDPAAVPDPAYVCGSSDGGGVHSNSGIPNRAFALLVDGDRGGDVPVRGIGFARALQIYWRAESLYELPATDFADHADALDAACADLVGVALADPFGGPEVVLSAGDCEQVAAASAAVALREDPPCDFDHLLSPDTPPLCGGGHAYELERAGFEVGAEGWTTSRRAIADPATFDPRDWTRVDHLPDRRPGFAFFAPDPSNGSCVTGDGGDDDSGVLVLESPSWTLPVGRPARLAFDHDLATEPGWDGGNLKLSVGGGPWMLVPAAAFRFNAYTGELFAAPENTDPLAGEPAFHGTDAGSNSGSWGTSIVDLAALVPPGVPFRLRFELGSDGCFGSTLGWWIDDVRLVACVESPPLFLDGFEAGGTVRWSSSTP